MVVDVSAVTYFAPIMAFLVVFLMSFAVLYKTKIAGESKWVILFLSFILSTLFVSAAGVRRYVEVITPWFGALLLSLFFLLLLIGFVGGKVEGAHNALRWIFIVAALAVFIISGVVVFSDTLGAYLPGSISYEGSPVTEWLYSPPVIGAVLLLIITAAVSWVLVKAK